MGRASWHSPAGLTVGLPRAAASGDGIFNDSEVCGTSSVGRVPASQVRGAECTPGRAGEGAANTRRFGDDASAHECNDSATTDGRGKLTAEAAVSIRGAIDMLDQGDVEGARKVLAGLLDDQTRTERHERS
jgi:hypothetical protein